MRRLTKFMWDFYKNYGTNGYILKCECDIKKYFASINRKILKKMLKWFGLYYLDKMDGLVKEKLRVKYYTRYMDDMILIHKSKNYLRTCLNEMQIFPIKNDVDYLGFRFYLTVQDITRSLTSYCSHLKHGHTYKLKKKILSGFVLQTS